MAKKNDNSHYISLSDMMTGLMLVFMFVSVAFMLKIQYDSNPERIKELERCEQMKDQYFTKKENMYSDLKKEFDRDLKRWNAEITPDLSFKFTEKTAQFDTNEAELKEEFKEKLQEFFPRYIATIMPYKDRIQEIRVEGHTDTTGPCDLSQEQGCVIKAGPYQIDGPYTNEQKNYLYNMALSQARAKNVLAYCLTLGGDFPYMKDFITANGLSYSKMLKTEEGKENLEASRRVEFRVLLNAEDALKEGVK